MLAAACFNRVKNFKLSDLSNPKYFTAITIMPVTRNVSISSETNFYDENTFQKNVYNDL